MSIACALTITADLAGQSRNTLLQGIRGMTEAEWDQLNPGHQDLTAAMQVGDIYNVLVNVPDASRLVRVCNVMTYVPYSGGGITV